MDKEKQIEELGNALYCKQDKCNMSNPFEVANCVINLGNQKINEDYIVISKEEYERLKEGQTRSYTAMINSSYLDRIEDLENRIIEIHKETAEKILNKHWNEKLETEVTISKYCSKEDAENIAKSIISSIRNAIKELAKEFGVDLGEEK